MVRSRQAFRKSGYYPIPRHYYYPLFNDEDCILDTNRELPGIDLCIGVQLEFLHSLDRVDEVASLGLNRKSPEDASHFSLGNGLFESGDAEFLYQFIRATKPQKVVEIGGGHSTKLVAHALRRNFLEGSCKAMHTVIEPYEQPWLEALSVDLVRKPVQACSRKIFDNLSTGDLLFIDSSHVIRPSGDVLFEYLQIIPSLKSGVYVHIHDIFTPNDYPESWLRNHVLFWNEQYLLEALLGNSTRYKTIAALNYLKNNHYGELARVCPYLTLDREPGSFYFQIR
jgi:hypothetical protein